LRTSAWGTTTARMSGVCARTARPVAKTPRIPPSISAGRMAVPPRAGSADENAGARPFILFQSADDETEVKNTFRAGRARSRGRVKINAGGAYTPQSAAAKSKTLVFNGARGACLTPWKAGCFRALTRPARHIDRQGGEPLLAGAREIK